MKPQTILEIDDMKKFYVADYGAAMSQLSRVSTLILFYDSIGGKTDTESNAEILRALDEVLHYFKELPLSDNVKHQAEYLRSCIGKEPSSVVSALMKSLHNGVAIELAPHLYLSLDPFERSLFEQDEPLFGKEVHDKFSSATLDINETGKCLALERYTASVFHLMRVMEISLKAVAACLGVTEPKSPNWGSWLNALRENIKERGSSWEEKVLFQDLYSRFDAIKDAQRNTTMHVDSVYAHSDAHDIFNLTRGLMNKIAARMDQCGNPRASEHKSTIRKLNGN